MFRNEEGIGKDAFSMTDWINPRSRETYDRELCRFVPIFHGSG